MSSRRDALGLLALLTAAPAALAWPAGAFEARSLAAVLKALGGAAPVESRELTLTAPDVAENGAAVPLTVSTALPGVKRLLLLVEKNPNLLAAVFEPGEAVEPSLSVNLKLAESSNVFAVAQLADGRVLFTKKDVRTTLGGCGA